jgi:hypothetical protein
VATWNFLWLCAGSGSSLLITPGASPHTRNHSPETFKSLSPSCTLFVADSGLSGSSLDAALTRTTEPLLGARGPARAARRPSVQFVVAADRCVNILW